MLSEEQIKELLARLEPLASAVGFKPAVWGELTLDQPPPEGLVALFEADYALLLAVRSRFGGLRQAVDGVRPALLSYLAGFELVGPPRDAYLLLVVPDPLNDNLQEIWDVETDPFVCRKHVVHAGGGSVSWSSVFNVTVLGIGARPKLQVVDLDLTLDSEVEAALTRLANRDKAETVVLDWAGGSAAP